MREAGGATKTERHWCQKLWNKPKQWKSGWNFCCHQTKFNLILNYLSYEIYPYYKLNWLLKSFLKLLILTPKKNTIFWNRHDSLIIKKKNVT